MVGVVNDIARMDAAECIASALRNLYRRLEAGRATLTDLLLLLLGARITVHLFSVAARRTGAQLGHLRSRLTACGRPCSNADRAPMPCSLSRLNDVDATVPLRIRCLPITYE